ncbi:SGNH/GDSL hydrolase family protein [Kineothrix sp. MB12-C1]|uniref:SGNH/GDSL hydrolase family protein n=1 Tax=Kineothrix sp. MB12-C1 TaxID=3070215 RepID=UPI0027D3452B|nr:SGNH/GDSL hydrolase family protein [Kineothrix sp. MB12-C1]WMC93131.1 SGNH/GDSL hydrolase family protein [Kineothrix sp. MB12-C1]
MKKDMYHMQKVLLYIIGILAIVLAVLLFYKGYSLYREKVHQEKLDVRNQEVQSELDDIQMEIQKLSGDGKALQEFLDKKINDVVKEEIVQETEAVQEVVSGAVSANEGQSADEPYDDSNVEDNAIIIDVPEKARPQETEEDSISANASGQEEQRETISDRSPSAEELETISGNSVLPEEAETISGNNVSPEGAETISGNTVSPEGAETVSGNTVSQEEAETISGNAVVDGQVIPFEYSESGMTLEARRNIRSSYAETTQRNGEDKAQIAGRNIDFSDKKIACLGDSITAGSNLNNLEEYQKYSYPSVLKNILNAQEVYNLGIGGSSYGRYWDEAFVDRYKEIPEDSDIILVMGGTNDGFAASAKELGSIEERKPRTFYGDVDGLMRGLKKNYPNAKIIFATPLPNILHDYLMQQRDYLLPQRAFVNAIKELAAEYEIDVIDLYNSNMLDTHDAQVISTYMPDGVHGNPAGYQILAEHFAAEIIRSIERGGLQEGTVSGNSSREETISGNALSQDAVSGNGTFQGAISESAPGENTIDEPMNTEAVINNAVIIPPSSPSEEETDNAQNDSNTNVSDDMQNNYQYSGEAIIIQ